MPPRASWKGFLNLSLVSVPVKAYTSSNSGGQIRLNQLHAECKSRIKQQTVCPLCGEIARDEIVKGYEYAKDQYVVIDLDELEKLRANDDGRAIRINTFVSPASIDPIYYSETNYYLVPDGAAGQKSYALLREALQQERLHCVAHVVLHNKEHLVLIRPLENLLCMTALRYASQVKLPSSFEDELADADVTDAEYELAKTLIDQSTSADFVLENYKDEYTEKLTQLIEAKVNNEEVVATPDSESPQQVLNLMEALKASVSLKATPGKRSTKIKRKTQPTMKKVAKSARKASTKKIATSDMLEQQLAKPKRKTTKRKRKTG